MLTASIEKSSKLVQTVPKSQETDTPLVVVSGNIGTGKTTLCQHLQECLPSVQVFYEKFEENQHLKPFYDHLKEHGTGYNPHSYPSQLQFLQGRIRQEAEFFEASSNHQQGAEGTQQKHQPTVHIADRSVFEDAGVFARSHYLSGLMSAPEYESYQQYLREHQDNLKLPTLVVHLKLSPDLLCARIKERGREMEKDISETYLSGLQQLYDAYVGEMQSKGCRVLEIGTENREAYPLVVDTVSRLLQTDSGESSH